MIKEWGEIGYDIRNFDFFLFLIQNFFNSFEPVRKLYLMVIIEKETNETHVSVLVWVIFANTNLNVAFQILSIRSFQDSRNHFCIPCPLFAKRMTLLNSIGQINPNILEQKDFRHYKFCAMLMPLLISK